VARFSLGATRRFLPQDYRVEIEEVNGEPALVIRVNDRALLVLTVEVEAQQIQTVRIVANPEKLARI
jgi:RNA polymerase sigma-70 factor (ECF subfamily)